jgi:acetaldehyde dehydrogenase (acetylating)
MIHKDLQSIQEARELAESAYSAFQEFEEFTVEQVDAILAEISRTGISHAESLARLAVEETGYGVAAHKTLKNLFCARNVYDAIKPLRTIGIVNEDKDRRIFEVASPIGVIAAIIPSTNPTSTVLYKALIALKGRNTIVFSPHPSAVRCISETSRLIAAAAERAGAPRGVISCMQTPTLEGTDALMKHEHTALILATGGTGLVKAAYSAGKPAYGVGPGNVPTYVERSADIDRAAADILTGKTFDNGTLCSSEQSIVCDVSVRDTLLESLKRQGAYVCNDGERQALERVIQTPRRTLNTRIVGQSAGKIAQMAGFSVPPDTRALIAHGEGVGLAHPISMEKLSPLLGFFTVRDWREGCEKCIEILKFGGLGHTLSLHTRDDEIVRQFGLRKPAFRICVNTPAALGAVGYTTNLFPSMTLGCGAQGNNITSDNISPLHLINLKRVAYGVRTVDAPAVVAASAAGGRSKRAVIENVVDGWLDGRKVGPPLESFSQLEPQPAKQAAAPAQQAPGPAGFVCEEDVRAAIVANTRIRIGNKTIVTPAARDLGTAHDIFLEN